MAPKLEHRPVALDQSVVAFAQTPPAPFQGKSDCLGWVDSQPLHTLCCFTSIWPALEGALRKGTAHHWLVFSPFPTAPAKDTISHLLDLVPRSALWVVGHANVLSIMAAAGEIGEVIDRQLYRFWVIVDHLTSYGTKVNRRRSAENMELRKRRRSGVLFADFDAQRENAPFRFVGHWSPLILPVQRTTVSAYD